MPIRPEIFFAQTFFGALHEQTILKAAAGEHDVRFTGLARTATIVSTSMLWNRADIAPRDSPLLLSSMTARMAGSQSITIGAPP